MEELDILITDYKELDYAFRVATTNVDINYYISMQHELMKTIQKQVVTYKNLNIYNYELLNELFINIEDILGCQFIIMNFKETTYILDVLEMFYYEQPETIYKKWNIAEKSLIGLMLVNKIPTKLFSKYFDVSKDSLYGQIKKLKKLLNIKN